MIACEAPRAAAIPASTFACNFVRESISEPLSEVATIAAITAARFEVVTPATPMSAKSSGVNTGEATPPAATAASRATTLAIPCSSTYVSTSFLARASRIELRRLAWADVEMAVNPRA